MSAVLAWGSVATHSKLAVDPACTAEEGSPQIHLAVHADSKKALPANNLNTLRTGRGWGEGRKVKSCHKNSSFYGKYSMQMESSHDFSEATKAEKGFNGQRVLGVSYKVKDLITRFLPTSPLI
jgi:hypothetical protein